MRLSVGMFFTSESQIAPKDLPRLTSEEHRRLFELLGQLESQNSQALTPEESAAIDEAIRSLDAGIFQLPEYISASLPDGPGDLRTRGGT
jgi:hypothetical protein